MKKIIVAFLLLMGSINAKATHLMGGEITAKFDSTLNAYIVILTYYRDTLGVPLALSEVIYIYSESGSGNYIYFDQHTKPIDSVLSTSLLPNFPYGIEVGVYLDTLVLPQGKYRITNQACCRNGAILNMATPTSESIFLYTDLYVDSLNNSTPDFLAMPVAYFPVNQPAVYNPLPFDPDLDSISWALNIPIGLGQQVQGSILILNNVSGFQPPAASPSGPFTMNPVTGQITWMPDTIGNYVQSFEVNEIKNNVPVGRIIRDMQYVIVPSSGNTTPIFQTITPYNTNTLQDYNYKYYFPGQPFNFQIMGIDLENDSLQMSAFSSAFKFTPPAIFTTFIDNTTIVGTFQWTPPANFTKDVILVFRLRDGNFAKDFTLLLRKGNPNAIENLEGNVNSFINVFPNPTTNNLQVTLQLDQEMNSEIALFSSFGQRICDIFSGKINKGVTKLNKEFQVSPGMYFLVVRKDNRIVKTLPVVVQ